jgi:UDP-N-acetylglucosamine 2-epimerase
MLAIAFGTRPEFVKLKPIMKYLDGKHPFRVIFTGQHEHLVENLPNHYDVVRLKIQDGKNRLDSIVSSVMNLDCFENVTHLMTQGDTTSAFAMSLAAFHRKIKVIHLEAGLRTYDMNNPYPEEANRQLISRIADIHLCPTKLSHNNLEVEMAPGKKYVVGNTVLDNIVNVPVTYSNEVLITMHRRENHDIIPQWFKNLEQATLLDKELRFVFVSHPNPNVQQHLGELKNVKVISPMNHEDFIKRLASCKFIITDSGGLQEESSFLRKYSIVCRKVTERKSGVGKWAKLCDLPGNLIKLIEETNLKGVPPNDWVCPYGDGKSSEKVYKVLKECGVFDV